MIFQLRGEFYSSHSVLDPATIGTGTVDSLLCVTTIEGCCQSNNAGQWYYPDGVVISESTFSPQFITRGDSVVRLNRASAAVTPSGLYRCEVPVSVGTESVYIGLYPVGQGW